MDRETLERLLIDRSLGALDADGTALLEAYVAIDPGAAALERQIKETTELARRALQSGPVAALPEFPADQMLRANRRQRSQRILRTAAAAAACVLIGLGVGALLFRGERPVARPASSSVAVSETADERNEIVAVPAGGGPVDGALGFWSERRLSERHDRSRPAESVRVVWTSPVASPAIGGGQ